MGDSVTLINSHRASAEENPFDYFFDDGKGKLRFLQTNCHPDKWDDDRKPWAQENFTAFANLHAMTEKNLGEVKGDHTYILRDLIAVGELRNVYRATSEDRHQIQYVVKVPMVKSRAANNLVAKELEVIRDMREAADDSQYSNYFPAPVESITSDKQRINVFLWPESQTWSATSILGRYSTGVFGRHIAWMFKRTLVALGFAHTVGWCNGAITPDHLMFSTDNHGLIITGWIHAEKSGKPIKVVPTKHKHLYPQEVVDTKIITPGTDIFMAARCMSALCDKTVDVKIVRFLRGCMLGGKSQPQDAWKLHDEFDELLRDVYGKPKFVDLPMVGV